MTLFKKLVDDDAQDPGQFANQTSLESNKSNLLAASTNNLNQVYNIPNAGQGALDN